MKKSTEMKILMDSMRSGGKIRDVESLVVDVDTPEEDIEHTSPKKEESQTIYIKKRIRLRKDYQSS